MGLGETVPDIDFDGDYVAPDPVEVGCPQEAVSGSFVDGCADGMDALRDFEDIGFGDGCADGMDPSDAAAASATATSDCLPPFADDFA